MPNNVIEKNPHLLLHFGSQRSQNGLTFWTQRHFDGSVEGNLSLVLLVLGAPLGWIDRRNNWLSVMNETWCCDAPRALQQQTFSESDDRREGSDWHQVTGCGSGTNARMMQKVKEVSFHKNTKGDQGFEPPTDTSLDCLMMTSYECLNNKNYLKNFLRSKMYWQHFY